MCEHVLTSRIVDHDRRVADDSRELLVIDGVYARAATNSDLTEVTRPIVTDDAVDVFPFDGLELACRNTFGGHTSLTVMALMRSLL